MMLLVLGLTIFIGLHSLRIVADPWRTAQVVRLGEMRWKLLYSVASLLGFGLIVFGYGEARLAPVMLWAPPLWTRHLAALLMLPAMILLLAAYVPGNRLKAAVGHPMVAGTKLWALSHLIANGSLADTLLFGGFLAWSIACFVAARRRDRMANKIYAMGPASRTWMVVIAGTFVWGVFALYLHAPLIGVAPFGAI
jgi:uncharacterized membrane protein